MAALSNLFIACSILIHTLARYASRTVLPVHKPFNFLVQILNTPSDCKIFQLQGQEPGAPLFTENILLAQHGVLGLEAVGTTEFQGALWRLLIPLYCRIVAFSRHIIVEKLYHVL